MKHSLCGGPRCCPTVEIEEKVVIKDDYGGIVQLTLEEFARLQAIKPETDGVYQL